MQEKLFIEIDSKRKKSCGSSDVLHAANLLINGILKMHNLIRNE